MLLARLFGKKTKIIPPLEGYNLWAASYHGDSNPVKDLSDNLVEKFMPPVAGRIVLDAGCGTGKFCSIAEKQGAAKVVGIDLSPNMVEKARQHCTSTELICADLSVIAVDEKKFDVIVCALVLGYVEHLGPTLDRLLSGLRPGGILIITDFHPFLSLAGGKRTFRDSASKETFEVRNHLHLFQEYFKCLARNDAIVEDFEEPEFNGTPLLFGIRAKKND